jgi:hypothetical protein
MESATTNLSEITCDFVRLWDGEALAHRDVRELFVHQGSVVAPEAMEVQVGQETDVELVYPAPTDEQVPSLKGLLAYIDARGAGGVINKHFSLKRKHFTLNEGPVQQVQQHKAHHRHTHEALYTTDQYTTLKQASHQHTHHHEVKSESHHTYQKKVSNIHRVNVCSDSHHSQQRHVHHHKTTRVMLEVFAPVLLVRQTRTVKITRPIYIFAS